MQIMMQKNAEKQKKREIKRNPSAGTQPSAAEALGDEIVRAKSESGGEGAPAPSASPAAPAPASKGGDGTVDISDI